MTHGDTGDVYQGNWLNDKAHGKGLYIYASSGAIYEGDWIEDRQEGYGVESWPDGTKYEGCFVDGLKHGRGKLQMWVPKAREFSLYDGDFYRNMLQGQGILRYNESN
jgi:hypothetical protein